jgi:ERCC4-type nuclease
MSSANNLICQIDTHEKDLIQLMGTKYPNFQFESVTLDIGDILYLLDGQPKVLVERKKTPEDYSASIKDGRSRNQVLRIQKLMSEYPNLIVIYLIEGVVPKTGDRGGCEKGVTGEIIRASMLNRIIRDRFTLYPTSNLDETADFATQLFKKINEHLISDLNSTEMTNLTYLKTLQVAKKDNLTPANCFIMQLSQIPGVSVDTASQIASAYPNWNKLLSVLINEKALENFPLKNRRLGPALSKKLYDFSVGNESVSETKDKVKVTLKLKPQS